MTTAADWTCWRDESHTVNETIFGWPRCLDCGAAPNYPDRWDYLRENFVLGLYLPHPEATSQGIAEGSGIVGLPEQGADETSWVKLYYEGYIYGHRYEGSDRQGLWKAAVDQAAGRMVCAYPTIAQRIVPPGAVQLIGLYYPKTKTFEVDDNDALERWLA